MSQKQSPIPQNVDSLSTPSSSMAPFSRIPPQSIHASMALDHADPTPEPFDQPSAGGAPDIFEKRDSTDVGDGKDEQEDFLQTRDQICGDNFDDLPIEMMSLTDRFVESLSAKVYDTPPSIDKLASLFQDFYIRASSRVETHVSILASRLRRGNSPSPARPQTSSKYSFSSKRISSAGDKAGSDKTFSQQQMLTATEVAERRRTRKLFQIKRQVLEEAIERRACESVYDKIWRHRSTLDEVRDEKLRSKTAALSVVGFGLKDLGVEVDASKQETTQSEEWLANARKSLMQMSDAKFPLGKLQHLTAAHKAIVDSLTKILPSSSSADEILPTLIYALVTSPPEGMSVISNLLFIQRFRATARIDGETAYCLTNLEAAISFLENVDLTSTENIAGNSRHPNSLQDSIEPQQVHDLSPVSVPSSRITVTSTVGHGVAPGPPRDNSLKPASTGPPQHRLSSIFQPPAKALEAANDIVRNTADQGIKNISNTLDNSFKFLFGRLKEVQLKQGDGTQGAVGIVPKTLDDARRLVNSPAGIPDDLSGEDPPAKEEGPATSCTPTRSRLDDRLASLVAGRKPVNNHIIKHTEGESGGNSKASSTSASSNPQMNNPPFGSMRGFGNTLNPLSHIPGMIRGLGRSSTEPSQGTAVAGDGPELSDNQPGLLKEKSSITGIAPPIKRFTELEDATHLKIGDIPELLEDYKRLASIINNLSTT
ncbi:predicted protein [Uncinocarpus reesii 1704]|uniref:VPS9 domain-containing protein n=1 Tax=Uncinocarpus reesii (strain UAMH 1704) TaxID=336963 RepID=C4JIX0_UNCRE|nr:uncharacterized protein UREG_01577 [Uncinocarpus reesii 1704]EEP76728.1 predicted protein [Uncinocarpus reesii 1704]